MRNLDKAIYRTFPLVAAYLVACATSSVLQKPTVGTELSETPVLDPPALSTKRVVEKRCGRPVSREEFCEECMEFVEGKWQVELWPNCRWKGYIARHEQECLVGLDEIDLSDLDKTPLTPEEELQRYCAGYRPKKTNQIEE